MEGYADRRNTTRRLASIPEYLIAYDILSSEARAVTALFVTKSAGVVGGHFEKVVARCPMRVVAHLTEGESLVPVLVGQIELGAVVAIEAAAWLLHGEGSIHIYEAFLVVQLVT